MKTWWDNMRSIKMAKNPIFYARTKHIEIFYHFVKEQVQNGTIEFNHVSTEEQLAGIFNKTPWQNKFWETQKQAKNDY